MICIHTSMAKFKCRQFPVILTLLLNRQDFLSQQNGSRQNNDVYRHLFFKRYRDKITVVRPCSAMDSVPASEAVGESSNLSRDTKVIFD